MPNQTNQGRAFGYRSVRHAIYLQRYNASVVRRIIALLNRTDADIVRRLAIETGETARSLEATLAEIRALNDRSQAELRQRLREASGELAGYEAGFTQRLGESVSGVSWAGPTLEQARAAALSRPFQGPHLAWANLSEHVDELGRRRGALVRDTIRRGFLEGDSVDDIVKRLRGTRALGYRDGLLEASRRTTETIVRTALTHTANAARSEVYKLNAAIISGVRWTAILDGRTSAVCRGRDGQIFPVDSGPRPPAHPNCRSTTVPVFKDEEPPKIPTYGEWLKEQDEPFVKSLLGEAKGALFLDGGLSLDRFIDNSGREYTLEELRIRDAKAFAKAGI